MGRPEDPPRPDPDALLARTRAEGRGELRVFLGMAPGVGKTYEMLSSAARRKEEGADVVVGVVETHGRRETEALTEGLETLARQPIEHRGRMLLEFDLDAALVRRRACSWSTSTPTPTRRAHAIPSAGRTWRSCSPPGSTCGPR